MNKAFRTLRARLFVWYIGSLIILALFFYLVVHIFAVAYGTELFILLFTILAAIGLFIIYRITWSITYLSNRIRHISRKNLEERILDINSNDEIGELAISFNSLLDNLNDAFKREQQFIGDVAHELKTPLATLRSTLEIALAHERKKREYQVFLHDALNETNHLSSTLKNVLDLAWSETHEEKKNMQTFNVSELIEELCDIAEKLTATKKLKLETSVHKDIFVNGYRDRLARALLNIIDNAIKYTYKGEISIILRRSHHRAFLTISDTGQGITEGEIPKIFTRFYRGSKTDKIMGSGLGLAISKSVITLHQGHISVESKVNKGTTFTIVLPTTQQSS